jgi:WD40 repeat protein
VPPTCGGNFLVIDNHPIANNEAMVRKKSTASIASLPLRHLPLWRGGMAGLAMLCIATLHGAVAGELAGLPLGNIAVQLKPAASDLSPPVVTAISIDPRGEVVAAAGEDHIIRILDRLTLSPIIELSAHEDWVQSLDFSPDGSSLVSVANDGQLITWYRDNQWEPEISMHDLPALRAVRVSPNGKMVATVGFSQRIFLMGIGNDARPTLNCGCRDLRAIDFRGDGMMLAAAGRSGDVFFFDAVTGSTIEDVKLNQRRIYDIKFIGNSGRVVTVAEDGHVVVYDTESKRVIHDLEVVGCKLLSVCVVSETHLAVGGSDNMIRIFDLSSGVLVDELRGHTGSVATLRSTEGILFSGSFDTTLRRWNLTAMLADETVADGKEESQPLIRTSRLP